MESMNSNILSWNVNPTSQFSKSIGAFGNLASKHSLRFAGVLSMESPPSLLNSPSFHSLSLETMVRLGSVLT